MLQYITLNIAVEFSCFLIAISSLHKDRNVWKIMPVFLLIVVGIEISGKQFALLHIPNQWLYNIYLILEAAFVGLMFYRLLNKRKAWILAALFLFAISFIMESYLNGLNRFLSKTNLLSSTLFVLLSLYYYYQLLQDEEYYNLKFHPPFWWVTGCLFFYFGGTVCNIFFDYLSLLKSADIGFPLRYIIFSLLNFILYSCWSYSFICRYRQRNSSTLSALQV